MTAREKALIAVAVLLAADATNKGNYKSHHHERTLVKRSLIEELRSQLDALGFGDDWRSLHKLVREEERQPRMSRAGF